MSMTPSDNARPDFVRVVIHQAINRRGRRQFLATVAGRKLCLSFNPIVCSAAALSEAGCGPSTQILFRDGHIGIEETMTLAEATAWRMPGLGDVVPLFGRMSS